MTTQVIFKIDPVLKKRAHKKAQAEGFTYSEMLQSATRAYVEGKYQMAGFVPSDWEPVGITREELVKIKRARENYRKGNYYTVDQVRHELGIRN